MSQAQAAQSQVEEQVLVASLHDVRPLASILRGVSFCSNATVSISEAGLTVSVEEARILVARAYIPLSLFDEFKYKPEDQEILLSQDTDTEGDISTSFEIPLDTLLECLNIFGTGASSLSAISSENKKKKKWKADSDDSDDDRGRGRGKRGGLPRGNTTLDQFFFGGGEKKTGMRMYYTGSGHPLTLILAEDATGPKTTCEIRTTENETLMDLPFDDRQRVIKVILRSSWLRDALSELDPSCDKLTFIGTPPSDDTSRGVHNTSTPTLRLSAEGTFGSTQMDYPNDREVLETFECAEEVKFTYRVAYINCALRALQSSVKTSLRIDSEGLLSLQFMMAAGGPNAFIEFKCQPLQDSF